LRASRQTGIPLSRLHFVKPDRKSWHVKSKTKAAPEPASVAQMPIRSDKKEKMVVHRDQPN
jgi:hypothetical protein